MKNILFVLSVVLLLCGSSSAKDDWNTAKSTHFIVYYKKAPEAFVKQVVTVSEDNYDKIAEGLGFRRFDFWLWDNRAKIYIYDNAQDYQLATGQPAWSFGCADTGSKVIKTFVFAQGFFDAVLPHEMGHIIFREFVGFYNSAVPLWLDEGVASFQEKSKYYMADAVVRSAMEKGGFMSLEKLSSFTSLSAAQGAVVQLFYTESFSMVNFLISRYGRDNFVLFCQNLRDKKNLEKAIILSYPFKNISAFEEEWKSYLTGK